MGHFWLQQTTWKVMLNSWQFSNHDEEFDARYLDLLTKHKGVPETSWKY